MLDFTGVTISSSIKEIIVHSDATFSAAQINVFNSAGVSISGDGGSTLRVGAAGSATDVNLDSLTLSGLGQLGIGDNITAIADQADIDAIGAISSGFTGSELKSASVTDLDLNGKTVFGGANVLAFDDSVIAAITASTGVTDMTVVINAVNAVIGATDGSDNGTVNQMLVTGLGKAPQLLVVVSDYQLMMDKQGDATYDAVLKGFDNNVNFIAGGAGSDTLIGGDGATNFICSGLECATGETNTITGGDVRDFIAGGDNADTIHGGAGDDFIDLSDTDGAADTVKAGASTEIDYILHFDISGVNTNDKIDVTTAAVAADVANTALSSAISLDGGTNNATYYVTDVMITELSHLISIKK